MPECKVRYCYNCQRTYFEGMYGNFYCPKCDSLGAETSDVKVRYCYNCQRPYFEGMYGNFYCPVCNTLGEAIEFR